MLSNTFFIAIKQRYESGIAPYEHMFGKILTINSQFSLNRWARCTEQVNQLNVRVSYRVLDIEMERLFGLVVFKDRSNASSTPSVSFERKTW